MLMIGPVWGAQADEDESKSDLLLVDKKNGFSGFFNENDDEEENADPLESMNRFFFEVNDKLYYWIAKPVNRVYTTVVPYDCRQCFGNFFDNIAAPIRVVNNLLQGKVADAGIDLSRFLINSTAGVLGLGDPALQAFGLEPRPEDFGQTLGVWGLGEGPYLYLPIVGPLTLRDSAGFIGGTLIHPATYVFSTYVEGVSYYSVEKINLLSLHPGLYEDMKRYSLDPYISVRQVYLEYRRNKVQDEKVKDNIIEKFR
jgi:phospholipid-binding lipoprotein MlaA